MELMVIHGGQSIFPSMEPLINQLKQRFASIAIQEMSFNQARSSFMNFPFKPNRVVLLLTSNMSPSEQMTYFATAVERSGAGLIMFPAPVSNNPKHLLAKTPEEIVACLSQFQRQIAGTQSPMISNLPLPISSLSQIPPSSPISPRAVSPSAILSQGQGKLGVNFFKSNNEIFRKDMNRLLINYQNDKRVKFNEVSNLNQIPIMPGGQHIIFVSDTDANIFISQLNTIGGRSDNFFPILYNTSTRTLPTGDYFIVAVNSLPRAFTEINTYINNISSFGSQNSIPAQIAQSASTLPAFRSNLPPINANPAISQAMIGQFSSGNLQMPGNHTRLIVLDPNSLYFQQFYRSLPVDYKLITHLQENAMFKQPTILLAPIQSYKHVMNRIYPQAINIQCVFYCETMPLTPLGSRFVGLVSANPREIENYLKTRGIFFMSNNITTIKNQTVFDQGQISAFVSMNGVNSVNRTGIWGNMSGNYSYDWTVRKKHGGQRHMTYLTEEEGIIMNRTNTHIVQPNIHASTTNLKLVGSLDSRENFEINSIPNQSQMRIGRTSFNSPKNIHTTSEINEVVTTVMPPPLKHTSKVVEEVYEETVIEARNKQPSGFMQQQSNHTITIDQIPLIPTIQITPPPTSRLSTTQPSNLQMNIQPLIIPPQAPIVPPPIISTHINQVVAPVIKEVIIEQTKITPSPIIEVPPITNGYYSSSTTTVRPTHSKPHVVQYSQNTRAVSPAVNVSRKVVESEWMDPIKYQKTFQNGRVTYVMRQEYKNRLIDDAVSRAGVTTTTYHDADYIVDNHNPRVLRKSRALYDTYVKPTYNEVEYIVDNPKIRRSRVIYQDIPATTIIPGTHVVQTSMISPSLDPLKYQARIQNGVQVYYKRSSVSPLRRSNNLIVEHVSTPVQYRTSPAHIISQPLRKSIVIEQRIPRSSSRVIVQHNPVQEVIQLRRSNAGLRGSRVYRTSRVDDTRYFNRHQPIHLIFKKLNNMLVSTSQLFKDPQYQIHKYYNTNQLAALARSIPSHEPIVLVVDEVPDSTQYFLNHSNFNTVVIPKNRHYSRAQEVKYPKYKFISHDDPQRVYGEIVTYIDQFVHNPRPSYNVNRISNDLNHFVSPGHYGNNEYRHYNQYSETRPGIVNSSKKILLYPIDRTEVRDYVDSRLPNLFDFIPYADMNSLTKQLDYWPGSNLVAVLSEPLAQQIGTIMRISRNADFVIYDPNSRYGNQKQDYNSIKRVRDVQDLVVELEYMLGGNIRGRSYR